MVVNFFGENKFLSPAFYSPLVFRDITFPSVTNAFEALRSTDPKVWHEFTHISGSTAHKRAKLIEPHTGYTEAYQLQLMYELNKKKFTDHRDLLHRLHGLGDVEIIYGNHWGETFWGMTEGRGHNHLGNILKALQLEL